MNTVKITYFLAEGKINRKTETLLRVEFIVEIAKSPFLISLSDYVEEFPFVLSTKIYLSLSNALFRPSVFLFETELTTFSFLISI